MFVEGPDDVTFFEELTKTLHPELAVALERRIKFVPSDGYRNIHAFALMTILKSENVKVRFFVIADSDGRSDRAVSLLEQIIRKVPESRRDQDLSTRIKILEEYELEAFNCFVLSSSSKKLQAGTSTKPKAFA